MSGDEFLQPPPGTAIQGHLRAGLLPIGLALAAEGSASADAASGTDRTGLLACHGAWRQVCVLFF
jgi:hypothetical protein